MSWWFRVVNVWTGSPCMCWWNIWMIEVLCFCSAGSGHAMKMWFWVIICSLDSHVSLACSMNYQIKLMHLYDPLFGSLISSLLPHPFQINLWLCLCLLCTAGYKFLTFYMTNLKRPINFALKQVPVWVRKGQIYYSTIFKLKHSDFSWLQWVNISLFFRDKCVFW